MPTTTPNFAIPYQTPTDPPDGPNLGEDGFLAVDTALAGLDVRIDALEAAAKYTRIAESVVGGTAASVTFSSIPATYRALQLMVVARSDTAAVFTNLRMQFNGDTAASYDGQELAGNGTTASAAQYIATTSMDIGQIAANSATGGAAGHVSIAIPWYASTTFWKHVTSSHVLTTGTGNGTLFSKLWAGRWRSAAAVSSITVLPQAGNFVAGTSLALYGLP